MADDQLTALIAALRDDLPFRSRFSGAASLDAALAIANEAGFSVTKADWLRHQARQTLELSDEELAEVAGGYVYLLQGAGEGYWLVK